MLKIFMFMLSQATNLMTVPRAHAATPNLAFRGEAKVSDLIQGPHDEGRVYFRGTWWRARCEDFVTLKPGDTVQVIDIQNITLIVEPMATILG